MVNLNSEKLVLVIVGIGFVGLHSMSQLLNRGYKVISTLRSLRRGRQSRRLDQNRVLAFSFLALVICFPSFVQAQRGTQLPTSESFTKQTDAQRIGITVTVTDKNAIPIVGLHKDNFLVLDETNQREISYFNADRIPASIGIILDISGSMSNPYRSSLNVLELVKEGLARFTQLLDSSDEYFIITFNKQVELLSEWGQKNINLETITSKKLWGGTALFDACRWGIQKVLEGKNQKRLIIVVTDGGDNESKTKFTELKGMIKANNLLVYVIGTFFGKDDSMDYDFFKRNQERLQELTTLSGGQIFIANSREHLSVAFEAIAQEQRAHYSIGFQTTNPTGKNVWHRVKIKLILPASLPKDLQPLVVRSRQGYIAQ